MAFTNYKYGTGLRNVGSYQVSGHPYITGSKDMAAAETEAKVQFPFVTKSVTVINSGSVPAGAAEIRVHFNSNADGAVFEGAHYISLNSLEDSFTFDVKCKEIYITNTVNETLAP